MAIPLRSATTTQGRKMAGARSLWRANGMREEHMTRPVIGIVNSFTQFVPGHMHLHEIGQHLKKIIAEKGCFAAEFNTIAIDDGIAMGHDGMLYSLPSREIIADSVETVMQAERLDGSVLLAGCDKSLPGMLMAAARLDWLRFEARRQAMNFESAMTKYEVMRLRSLIERQEMLRQLVRHGGN